MRLLISATIIFFLFIIFQQCSVPVSYQSMSKVSDTFIIYKNIGFRSSADLLMEREVYPSEITNLKGALVKKDGLYYELITIDKKTKGHFIFKSDDTIIIDFFNNRLSSFYFLYDEKNKKDYYYLEPNNYVIREIFHPKKDPDGITTIHRTDTIMGTVNYNNNRYWLIKGLEKAYLRMKKSDFKKIKKQLDAKTRR